MKKPKQKKCSLCRKRFSLLRWKHTCYMCGKIICKDCHVKMQIPAKIEENLDFEPERVCYRCRKSVQSEIDEGQFDDIQDIYDEANKLGFNEGYGHPANRVAYDNLKEHACNHERQPLAKDAFDTGYNRGFNRGRNRKKTEENNARIQAALKTQGTQSKR